MLLIIDPEPAPVLIRCDECGWNRPLETSYIDRRSFVRCAGCWKEWITAVLLQERRAEVFQISDDDCEITRIFAGENEEGRNDG